MKKNILLGLLAFAQLTAQQPRPGYWIWDGIHPTPAGHRRMADLWIKAFEGDGKK